MGAGCRGIQILVAGLLLGTRYYWVTSYRLQVTGENSYRLPGNTFGARYFRVTGFMVQMREAGK